MEMSIMVTAAAWLCFLSSSALGNWGRAPGCCHSNSGCDYYGDFPSGISIKLYLFIYCKNNKMILKASQHGHCVTRGVKRQGFLEGGGAILNL